MKKITFLLTLLTVGVFSGAGAVLADESAPSSVPPAAPAGALKYRALINPFDRIIATLEVLTTPDKAKALINKVKAECVKLEIPATDGCSDTLAALNDAVTAAKSALKDADAEEEVVVTGMRAAFTFELNILSDTFEAQYGGEERAAAEQPSAKPTNLYDVKKYPTRAFQASVNPFDPLVEWVDWMDKGSWYVKTMRSNSSVGLPKVISLVKIYCEKFESLATDGCVEDIKTLKDAIKKGRVQKVSRETIFTTFKTTIQYLSDKYESEFGSGEDVEMGGGTPLVDLSRDLDGPAKGSEKNGKLSAAVVCPVVLLEGGNPFQRMLDCVDWWKTGKILPGAIRTLYGPEMIKDVAAHCGDLPADSAARDHCPDSVSKSATESASMYRLFKTGRTTKDTKDSMISGMKSDLEYYRDNWTGAADEGLEGEEIDTRTDTDE